MQVLVCPKNLWICHWRCYLVHKNKRSGLRDKVHDFENNCWMFFKKWQYSNDIRSAYEDLQNISFLSNGDWTNLLANCISRATPIHWMEICKGRKKNSKSKYYDIKVESLKLDFLMLKKTIKNKIKVHKVHKIYHYN